MKPDEKYRGRYVKASSAFDEGESRDEVKSGFDPNQPRDPDGKWTGGASHRGRRLKAGVSAMGMSSASGRVQGRLATPDEITAEWRTLRRAGMGMLIANPAVVKELEKRGMAGAFSADPNLPQPMVYLRENPTFYELKHECLHAEQCMKMGIEKFSEQHEFDGELYVFNRLMEMVRNKEIQLNNDEIVHAGNYIQGLKRRYNR